MSGVWVEENDKHNIAKIIAKQTPPRPIDPLAPSTSDPFHLVEYDENHVLEYFRLLAEIEDPKTVKHKQREELSKLTKLLNISPEWVARHHRKVKEVLKRKRLLERRDEVEKKLLEAKKQWREAKADHDKIVPFHQQRIFATCTRVNNLHTSLNKIDIAEKQLGEVFQNDPQLHHAVMSIDLTLFDAFMSALSKAK